MELEKEIYMTDDDLTVVVGTYVRRNMQNTDCDVCGGLINDHAWIALGDPDGRVVKCSNRNEKPSASLSFTEYVAYNEYGGVVMTFPRFQLESWLLDFNSNGRLARGCWEFMKMDEAGVKVICARLSPGKTLDGKDNNWKSWQYTFVPKLY